LGAFAWQSWWRGCGLDRACWVVEPYLLAFGGDGDAVVVSVRTAGVAEGWSAVHDPGSGGMDGSAPLSQLLDAVGQLTSGNRRQSGEALGELRRDQ
jgi:hypothetical protein